MSEDPEYIAKLERAISEKYGKKAILNPRSLWDEEKEKKYLKDRSEFYKKTRQNLSFDEKEELDGFLVSKKLINKESRKTCSVCNKYSFENRDNTYFRKYSCCYECYIKWVDGREERWKKGWRPNVEKKEI